MSAFIVFISNHESFHPNPENLENPVNLDSDKNIYKTLKRIVYSK